MGENSKRLDLRTRFIENVSKVVYRNNIKLNELENIFLFHTKHNRFNNFYAEVIINYKLDKLDKV